MKQPPASAGGCFRLGGEAPGHLSVGGASCSVTIRGYGFASDAQVLLDGEPRAYQYVDSTTIELPISSEDSAAGRGFSLVIVNPDGQHSDVYPFGVFDYFGGHGFRLLERPEAPPTHADWATVAGPREAP